MEPPGSLTAPGRLASYSDIQLHRLHNRSVYPDGSSMGSPAISLAWFISTWAYFFAFSGSLARAASRAVKAGWS